MKQTLRFPRLVRTRQTDGPWWQPVGLWQSWWGIAFVIVAAALSHWN